MDQPDLDPEGKDRNFVTALARGLEILRCFGRDEVTLTNSEFSERTGLPKATVSRLTHTLCALDYLVADTRVGTYRLGAGVLQLGFSALASMDICTRAAPAMRALRDEGPNPFVTIALAEQYRLDVIYLATEASTEHVSLVTRVGSRLPIFKSAIGKAILVGMDDDQREKVFALAAQTDPDTEADARELCQQAQDEFAIKGFCTAYGTWRGDVNGIAVPVYSMHDRRVFGLNVGGPAYQVKPKQLETLYAERLIKAAESLTMRR